ncbi:MAG: glycosyl hydrolase 53 family protein [Nitrososphaerota archaeon]|nr:glycosyl hydrolase 53 family protein [Nitrososphaerota archaeon]
MFDMSKGFSFGINIDDPWRYAGISGPKSIIIPHLLSVSLPEGRVVERMDKEILSKHGHDEPKSSAERASLSLAENLQKIGINFIRCWFPWRFFESEAYPEKDLESLYNNSYRLWPMDSFVETLSNHGIRVIPVLACGYQRMLPKGLSVDANRDLYIRRASVHASLLVRRYRKFVKFWQIENEPNWWQMHGAGGWRKGVSWLDPHGFRLKLLKELSAAVRNEDPGSTTIINLESDSANSILDEARVCSQFADVIGLDYYPNYRSSTPINTAVIRNANEVARSIGRSVLIMETGYPSAPRILGYSESGQAEYIKSACRTAHDLDHVSGIGIWRYMDSSWRSFPDQENHFGLIDKSGMPKSAWSALAEEINSLK